MDGISSARRLDYLEAARGIASIIVVFTHFALGFVPSLALPLQQGGLLKTPLFPFINGAGAVAFFFVLSGFVLTLKFYQRFAIGDFVAAVLKRLPRLMLPAGLSMLAGAAILIYLPAPHVSAARLTGSSWLADFAGAQFPDDFTPGFSDALGQSLMVFLWPNNFEYNSNLWTMVYEFYGSLLVFGVAAISSLVLRNVQGQVVILHLLLGQLCIVADKLHFVPFLVGSLISFHYCRNPSLFRLSSRMTAMLTLTMFAGYSVANAYAITIASTAAMLLLLGVPALERRLGGRGGRFLGRLSFPLYLVHGLVILSFTSAAYTALEEYGLPLWIVLALSLALTWLLSILAALPFMALEKLWVPTLNRGVRALLRWSSMSSGIRLSKAE